MDSDNKDNGLGDKPEAGDTTAAASPETAGRKDIADPDDGIEDAEVVEEFGPAPERDWADVEEAAAEDAAIEDAEVEEAVADTYGAGTEADELETDAAEIDWDDESELEEPETLGEAEAAGMAAAETAGEEPGDDYLTPGVTAAEEIPATAQPAWGGETVAAAAAGAAAATAFGTAGRDSTTAAEPAMAAAPAAHSSYAPAAAPAPAERRGGGFAASVLGGLIAAGIGFAVAEYASGDLGRLFGGGPDPVEQALSAQGERLSGLETRIGEIATAVKAPDFGGIESQISSIGDKVATQMDGVQAQMGDVAGRLDTVAGELQAKLGDLDTQIAAVEERLSAVEKRPLVESSETARAAFGAYERELENLKTTLAAQQKSNSDLATQMAASADAAQAEVKKAADDAAAMQAQAQAEASQAGVRESLASLDAAIAKGIGYQAILDKLPAGTAVPEVLTAHAAEGVPSLDALQEGFAPAARAALDASIKETVSDAPMARFGAFLKTQTGMRSLEPKQGDDADAVLSRSEAAEESGDLATALAEIAKLPAAGQAAMAGWVEAAKTRLEVTQAAASLSETLLAQ